MAPEFRLNDMLIVDPEITPNPGDFVLAQLDGENEVLIRKYKQISASKIDREFELIALNENWADIRVSGDVASKLIGAVVFLNRALK